MRPYPFSPVPGRVSAVRGREVEASKLADKCLFRRLLAEGHGHPGAALAKYNLVLLDTGSAFVCVCV